MDHINIDDIKKIKIMKNYNFSREEIFLGDNKIKNRIVSSPISTNMLIMMDLFQKI